MASPIKRMMSLRETKSNKVNGESPSQSPNRKPKILKILRRQSFNQSRKRSNDETSTRSAPEVVDDQQNVPKPVVKSPNQIRDLEAFQQYHKELRSAVQYFILILNNFKSNMDIVMAKIPDNTSIVLESIINIDNMLDTCLRLHSSNSDLLPYRKSIHKRMAELVRWSDQLLVRGNVKGNLEEGIECVKDLEASVQELVDLAIPRLRKRELNDEIRNSIFMFEGSSESIQVGESDYGHSSNRRDSGISEGSLVDSACQDSSSSRASPATSRDSGRGSYNYILDQPDTAHHNGYLSPPEPPVRGRQSFRSTSNYNHQRNPATLKNSDWSLSQASDSSSYRSLPHSPVSSQDEFNGHAFLSASSSVEEEGSFFSADDHEEPEGPIIQASFLGYIENHELSTPKKKSFQVYIELVGNYTQPADGILKRPSSAYDGYQESFRRSISTNANSPTSPVLNKEMFAFRNVADSERSHSLPTLQASTGKLSPSHQIKTNGTLDWNKNVRTDSQRKKLLPLEEERCRKQSNTSSSSSSLSGTEDEDVNTPALDCLDVSRFLVYRNDDDGPTLIGGAIDALIVHASGSTKKDLVYYEAFLTTYRTFISPKDLITKLLYRERRFREKGSKRASQNAFFLLLRVVDELTGKVERSILEQLMKEVYRLLVNGDIVLGKILRDKMLPKCDNYYKSRSPSSNTSPTLPMDPAQRYTVLDFNAEDLAKQLTLIDARNFHNIEIPEILAWGKEQKEELSPNLCIFTDHFNKVSYWCRTHVLSFEKQKDREQAYLKFLKIMKHLRRFNDFNSFFGILSALDCSAVRRLNWPKNLPENLAEYATLIDSSSSFRSYRDALAQAQPPCIPYLGLILQDVTFVYHGNADELPDGKVNFVKRWQLFNIVDNVRRFKLTSYDFEWNDQISQLFAGMDNFLSEEDLYERSLKLKPRE